MATLRTIPQAVAEYREKDPKTVLTEARLRRMIKRGEIPHRRFGKNFVVSMESLEQYFDNFLRL